MGSQSDLNFYDNKVRHLEVDLNRTSQGFSSKSLSGGLTLVINLHDIVKDSQSQIAAEKKELPYQAMPASRTQSLNTVKQKPVPPPKPKMLGTKLTLISQPTEQKFQSKQVLEAKPSVDPNSNTVKAAQPTSTIDPKEQTPQAKQILEPKPSAKTKPNLVKALSIDCLSVSSGHGSLQSPPQPRPPRPRRKAASQRKLSIKPEDMSQSSSLESGISYSSATTSSSTQSSSPKQRRSSTKKQRASRESLNRFIGKHEQIGLTKSLPTQALTSAVMTRPYTEELMKKKQYLSIQKRHVVRDIKFAPTGDIILSTKSSVQLYDNNGVFKEKLYTNRVAEPWGLHVNHESGHVLVSDNDEECVKEFNALGIIVQEYGPVPGPRGVAMTSAGYVFVCSEKDSCVYVFDKRAQLITIIGQGVLSSPTYIALHHKTILVSDESRIIGFNVESEIEYVYGQADGSRHPSCLCVDNQTGFVLATSYYKDKLIALNQKSERAFRVKQASRPTLCAISPFGHLLIAENNPNGTLLKMFRMK